VLSNKNENDKNELAELTTYIASLLQIEQAAAVKVPPDVLDQGSEAQAPVDQSQTQPAPQAGNAGKGKSGSNPNSQTHDRQAPSA